MAVREKNLSQPQETIKHVLADLVRPVRTTRYTHTGGVLRHGVAVSINNLNIASFEKAVPHPGSVTPERSTFRR